MKHKLWLEPKTWRIALCVVAAALLFLELLPGSAVSAVESETGITYVKGNFLLPKAVSTPFFWLALLTTVSTLYHTAFQLVKQSDEQKWMILLRSVLLSALTVYQYTKYAMPLGKTSFFYCIVPLFVIVLLILSVIAVWMCPENGSKAQVHQKHDMR